MRGENTSVNVKNSVTGETKRVKRSLARELVDAGAWVYISNSEFRVKRRTAAKARADALAVKQEAEEALAAVEAAKVSEKAETRQGKNKKAKKAKKK